MTKKPQETLTQVEQTQAAVDAVERDDEWVRDSALGYAIKFHANNGGMLTAPQLVDNAKTFLAFLKGEDK